MKIIRSGSGLMSGTFVVRSSVPSAPRSEQRHQDLILGHTDLEEISRRQQAS